MRPAPLRLTLRMSTLAAIEHVLIVLAVALAAALRFDGGTVDQLTNSNMLWRASLIALVLQVSLHYCDLYDLRTLSDRRELVVGLVQALGVASLILTVYAVGVLISAVRDTTASRRMRSERGAPQR